MIFCYLLFNWFYLPHNACFKCALLLYDLESNVPAIYKWLKHQNLNSLYTYSDDQCSGNTYSLITDNKQFKWRITEDNIHGFMVMKIFFYIIYNYVVFERAVIKRMLVSIFFGIIVSPKCIYVSFYLASLRKRLS